MALLPDVNVVFALANAKHEHTAVAKAWLGAQKDVDATKLCRVVHMGLLRLLTQSAAMKDRVLSSAEAWSLWSEFLHDERFAFMEEP